MTVDYLGNPIHMDSFEEEAISLSTTDDDNLSSSHAKITLSIIALIVVCLIVAFVIILMPYLEENQFIADLREEGAELQTVSNNPSWMYQSVRTGRPNEGWFQTIWTARLLSGEATDKELKRLSQCQRLSAVTLSSDKATPEGLFALANAPRLKLLNVIACGHLSEDDVKQFKTLRPEVRANWQGCAFLGISSGMFFEGEHYYDILQGSPAQLAGIESTDQIRKIQGKKVDTFPSLVQQINSYQPGDEIEVELDRRNQTISLKVKLGDWRNRF